MLNNITKIYKILLVLINIRYHSNNNFPIIKHLRNGLIKILHTSNYNNNNLSQAIINRILVSTTNFNNQRRCPSIHIFTKINGLSNYHKQMIRIIKYILMLI